MIIHITREICWVVISGANGTKSLIMQLLQSPELKSEIARQANDPNRLSSDGLQKKLLKAIEPVLSGEKIEIYIH
jgi:hypothetical protein